MNQLSVFVASTGQHVGKTTSCLGLIAGLKRTFGSLGFMKPVGQQHVELSKSLRVDKDVALFKQQFNLTSPLEKMSPILIPRGFTKEYLEGKVDTNSLQQHMIECYESIKQNYQCMVVEGTGHVGVGSIIGLNNAEVAKQLNLDLLLIIKGGLGSTFDELMLNYALCEKIGVKIKGVIVNKVHPEKIAQVRHYLNLALKKLHIPLLGIIPFDPILTRPCLADFELLFQSQMITGSNHKFQHYEETKLVASSLPRFKEIFEPNQLVITPANREDIILEILTRHWEAKAKKQFYNTGLVLTGMHPPKEKLLDELKHAELPCIYTPQNSYEVMKSISSYVAKIRFEDKQTIQEAIQLMEEHIDFNQLINVFQK